MKHIRKYRCIAKPFFAVLYKTRPVRFTAVNLPVA
jgi:transposase-like protein